MASSVIVEVLSSVLSVSTDYNHNNRIIKRQMWGKAFKSLNVLYLMTYYMDTNVGAIPTFKAITLLQLLPFCPIGERYPGKSCNTIQNR